MEWSDGRGNVSSLHFQAGDGRKLKDKSKQKSPNVNITEWEGPHNFGKQKRFCHFEKD